MAPTTDELVLFPDPTGPPAGVVVLNDRCRLQERDGYRVVSVSGLPLAHFAAGDRFGEAHAMVRLIELGWARQRKVARGIGCDAFGLSSLPRPRILRLRSG